MSTEVISALSVYCPCWYLLLFRLLERIAAPAHAVIEAEKEVIGVHINARGCFYHLCQSTFRKVQELGLATMYKRDEEFRKHCGMVDALAFLSLHLVEEGMTYLKNNLPENLTDLLDYFDAYYVSGKYRRIGHEENNIRTNNIVEGWNNRFSKLVGQKHLTIWKLIRKIKNEINADRAKLTIDALEITTHDQIQGDKNVIPDALSRLETVTLHAQLPDFMTLSKDQDEDPQLQRILNGTSTSSLRLEARDTGSGLVYFDTSATGRSHTYVPATLRRRIFDILHNQAHPGIKATLSLVKEHHCWSDMDR
ncbi:hypothetical protein QTP88_022877 [Uroleucon formosanum]